MLFALQKIVKLENILPLTSRCNLRCIFCSNTQNPRGVKVFSLPPLPLPLARRLLPFLNPRRKIVIGEAASRITEGEPLTHPDFWKVLEMIRNLYPETPLQITTNGTLLDREAVQRLKNFLPLEVNLSLNSAAPAGRWLLMGDRGERALLAAELLGRAGVTYHGSIVALPHLVGWEDLRSSCRFLEASGAATIRLFLPGFTKLAPPPLRFPPEAMYRELEIFWREERASLGVPLLLEPSFVSGAEANFLAELAGVIPGSPAARAGLRKGDIVKTVHGRGVRSRVDAFQLIQATRRPVLEIERGGLLAALSFRKRKDTGGGVVMAWDLDWRVVEKVRRVIRSCRGRRVLVLTSEWGYPWLKKVLPEWEKTGAEVHLVAVPNRFFGGSIACAGLLTTVDFRRALRTAICVAGRDFDLVLLPAAAFDFRGRDLLGKHYSLLRYQTGAAVELV